MKANMTTHQFARTMKLVFGLTPSQYIAKTRLGAATSLLLDSDMTVAQVAYASGYSDHSAFSRAFKKATGTSPNTLRSRHKTPVPPQENR
jgi:AraC-like DNA-binding protein